MRTSWESDITDVDHILRLLFCWFRFLKIQHLASDPILRNLSQNLKPEVGIEFLSHTKNSDADMLWIKFEFVLCPVPGQLFIEFEVDSSLKGPWLIT